MRSLEREKGRESINQSLSRIAYAYGFSAPPIHIPKKSLSISTTSNQKVAASLALIRSKTASLAKQRWGSARMGSKGTLISFAIFATRHAVANALVVKTIISIAELIGLENITALVSSTGDLESRKRFTRELANFFKKNSEAVLPEVKERAVHDPDRAYYLMLELNDPLLEKVPRPIDFLSENSRKTMLETLSLFESVGIPYSIEARLQGTPNITTELLFAVEGTNKKGERVRVAEGGRFDGAIEKSPTGEVAVSMSMLVDRDIDAESTAEEPACYIVHVGDIAKLKAFGALETLLRSKFLVGQALMGATLREQLLNAQAANTRYVAIIGQREALDGTVIVRNLANQLQSTIPLEKLPGYLSRTRTH